MVSSMFYFCEWGVDDTCGDARSFESGAKAYHIKKCSHMIRNIDQKWLSRKTTLLKSISLGEPSGLRRPETGASLSVGDSDNTGTRSTESSAKCSSFDGTTTGDSWVVMVRVPTQCAGVTPVLTTTGLPAFAAIREDGKAAPGCVVAAEPDDREREICWLLSLPRSAWATRSTPAPRLLPLSRPSSAPDGLESGFSPV